MALNAEMLQLRSSCMLLAISFMSLLAFSLKTTVEMLLQQQQKKTIMILVIYLSFRRVVLRLRKIYVRTVFLGRNLKVRINFPLVTLSILFE